MSELRKYGVLLTTAKAIQFTLYKVDGVDIEPAATFATGDIKISKDGGAEADTTNLPTDEGQGYSIILTLAELTASRIRLFIVDQTATKVWLDVEINIETFGNASAMHAFDFDTAAETMRGTDSAALASALATAQNDLDTITDADGVILGVAGVDLILDEVIDASTHNTLGSLGNRVYLGQSNSWISALVNDASATATTFITNLSSSVTDFYKDQSVFFVAGALAGQSRVISGYNGTTKALTVDEAFTSTPADTTSFALGTAHIHPITQIQAGLATEAKQDAQGLIITETRLAELDAANLPANVDTLLARIIGTLASGTHNPATAAQIAVLSDWINAGRLDVILDAIKVVTDLMVFTKSNELDVNTKSINDAEVIGDGNATPWDGI